VIYCFDIDGTLCTNTFGDYEQAEPFPEVIDRVNLLHAAGNRIVLFTARGTTTGVDWTELTREQLTRWGVEYDELILGKPQADVYIDDRGLSTTEWDKQSSVFESPAYLDVTYSEAKAPKGDYPLLLAQRLLDTVYERPGRLLDLGCGRGDHLDAFAALGFETWGVDASPRSRETASAHRVEVADLERDALPVPAGEFDAVFSKSVVEHMHTPLALFEAAYTALKPGGVAVVMTPSWQHQHWGPFYIDHTHVSPFTAPSLAEAFTLASFVESRATHFRQLPFLWRYPVLRPVVAAVAALPLPYRPYRSAPWPNGVNKLVRFAKEVMLLGVARKPT
jgi:SAM-dependent methyltransferase